MKRCVSANAQIDPEEVTENSIDRLSFLKYGNKITCQGDICHHTPLAELNCVSETVTTRGPSNDLSGCLGLCDISLRLQLMSSAC